jgi:hypothetical protein
MVAILVTNMPQTGLFVVRSIRKEKHRRHNFSRKYREESIIKSAIDVGVKGRSQHEDVGYIFTG